ncbi:hypothetical protein GLOIN_2v1561082 [Rhizophagus irregularis DAOM 181602=DAOM 197198]|uniref:Uncharacterized protein n=1 Tax=Rhizophagus irregularis (strain DAOM 181602 / DAOM 197198 / MUCL 43194) TaxID=747089 RepID=A0A2P4QE01_RHIID|nr:hypothetical protein GLOIN_2v1561082 [Rhizophagus irregularis DAOM 181602=DAOM 197198]POG75850.1 hypothetical protein GLOIN_2v1561082 [Rhizophagus irregularis DAOM 181602=DAOM 197198]|eukprot:XP_025182716.1 hypothetical protein GLOIN_2v1561082 [Rhizophagus irregularis DAOM 181602=DAOM 197198]
MKTTLLLIVKKIVQLPVGMLKILIRFNLNFIKLLKLIKKVMNIIFMKSKVYVFLMIRNLLMFIFIGIIGVVLVSNNYLISM